MKTKIARNRSLEKAKKIVVFLGVLCLVSFPVIASAATVSVSDPQGQAGDSSIEGYPGDANILAGISVTDIGSEVIDGAQFTLTYDANVLEAVAVQRGSLTADTSDWYIMSNINTPGKVIIIFWPDFTSPTPIYLSQAGGEVARIIFNVKSNAPAGESELGITEAILSGGHVNSIVNGTFNVRTVQQENRPPILDPIGDRNETAGVAFIFNVTATDPDGDDLTYSSNNLPGGAEFNPATQIFLWGNPVAGVYDDVHFEVSDGNGGVDSEDITITVTQVPPTTYTLTINATNGSVTKAPNKAAYNNGETVTLTAIPASGYHFVNWSGAAQGTNSTVSVTMDANKTVTANFAINTYTLTITATNGSVTKNPDKASYNHGETVQLTAAPNTGYNFVNWTGGLTGSANPATITMNSNKNVTANFAENAPPPPTTYTLTINAANGSVTKAPNKAAYNSGETVTLTATANAGYHFVNWSGAASGTNSTVSVVMNSNKNVTANFAENAPPPPDDVKITVGTSSASPGTTGISIPIRVSALGQKEVDGVQLTLLYNTAALEAVAVERGSLTSNQSNWYDMSNINTPGRAIIIFWPDFTSPTPIYLNQAGGEIARIVFNVKANAPAGRANITFDRGGTLLSNVDLQSDDFVDGYVEITGTPPPTTYTLTITATNGSVAKAPNKAAYNNGETVTLTATPALGYHFVNWSGAASGTNSAVSVVMNSNKSVTANFATNAPPPTTPPPTTPPPTTPPATTPRSAPISHPWNFDLEKYRNAPYYYPIYGMAKLYGKHLSAGDLIGVFDEDGNCYGVGQYKLDKANNRYYYTLSAYPKESGLNGFEEGELLFFKFYSQDRKEVLNASPTPFAIYRYPDAKNTSINPVEINLVNRNILIVENALGSGSYANGVTVNVQATKTKNGIPFSHWTVEGGSILSDPDKISTNVTILDHTILTAHFEEEAPPATTPPPTTPPPTTPPPTTPPPTTPLRITQAIPLKEGWNFISFNVQPDNPQVEEVLGSILDKIEYLADHKSWWAKSIGGSLTELSPYSSYYIKVNADSVLTISGILLQPPYTVTLNEGWNSISYPYDKSSAAIGKVYGSLGYSGFFKDILPYIIWVKGGSKGSDDWSTPEVGDIILEKTKGVFIKMKNSATLTFPEDIE